MSPEIIAQRPYTFASDVWALGCILYEMAARRTAFEAKGLAQLVVKILRNRCGVTGCRACLSYSCTSVHSSLGKPLKVLTCR